MIIKKGNTAAKKIKNKAKKSTALPRVPDPALPADLLGKNKTIYVVGALKTELEAEVTDCFNMKQKIPLNLKSFAPGIIGVLPVFDSYEKAEEFAGETFQILKFEVNVKEQKNAKK